MWRDVGPCREEIEEAGGKALRSEVCSRFGPKPCVQYPLCSASLPHRPTSPSPSHRRVCSSFWAHSVAPFSDPVQDARIWNLYYDTALLFILSSNGVSRNHDENIILCSFAFSVELIIKDEIVKSFNIFGELCLEASRQQEALFFLCVGRMDVAQGEGAVFVWTA